VYTPSLGRRSCPLSVPLYVASQEAKNGKEALYAMEGRGVVYTEQKFPDCNQALMLRDVPMHGKTRRFGTRMVYIHAENKEGHDVS